MSNEGILIMKIDRMLVLRLSIAAILFALLFALALWLARPDGSVETSASQLVFERAEVTAVLSDDAVADYDNSEGAPHWNAGAGNKVADRRA